MLKPIDFDIFLKSKIGNCNDFVWNEALFLPKWGVAVMPTNHEVFSNIEKTAEKMQQIRNKIQKPIRITSWFRPQKYNEEIRGAKNSSHIRGLACDFQVPGVDADSVRALILPMLSELNIRMENLPLANWVHIDLNCNEKTPVEKRFFKP